MTEKIISPEPIQNDTSDVSNSVNNVTSNDIESHYATMITLVSRDEIRFSMSLKAAKGAGLIVDTLGCEDDEEDDNDPSDTSKAYEPITIPRVDAECLEKVIEFLQHHAEDPLPRIQQPLVGNSIEEVCVLMAMFGGMSVQSYNHARVSLELRWLPILGIKIMSVAWTGPCCFASWRQPISWKFHPCST
jgi:Skp1 family, tetramerisation domain